MNGFLDFFPRTGITLLFAALFCLLVYWLTKKLPKGSLIYRSALIAQGSYLIVYYLLGSYVMEKTGFFFSQEMVAKYGWAISTLGILMAGFFFLSAGLIILLLDYHWLHFAKAPFSSRNAKLLTTVLLTLLLAAGGYILYLIYLIATFGFA